MNNPSEIMEACDRAIVEMKAGGVPQRDEFTPQISVDAPIMIPETYVPDLEKVLIDDYRWPAGGLALGQLDALIAEIRQ